MNFELTDSVTLTHSVTVSECCDCQIQNIYKFIFVQTSNENNKNSQFQLAILLNIIIKLLRDKK